MRRLIAAALLAILCTALLSSYLEPRSGSVLGPTIGKSWLVGERARPLDGVIRIGSLQRSGTARPMAELVDPKRLDAFLVRLDRGEIGEVEELGETDEDLGTSVLIKPRRLHGVSCRVHQVLADQCSDLPLVVCPGRELAPAEILSLQAYMRQGGIVLLESCVESRRRALFGDQRPLAPEAVGLGNLGLDGLRVILRDERLVGLINRDQRISGHHKRSAVWAALGPLFRLLALRSAKVRVFEGAPFAVSRARRDADVVKVWVAVPRHAGAGYARVDAALVDLEGKTLWQASRRSTASVEEFAVPCAETLVDVIGSRLQLRWRCRGVEIYTAPTIESLVGTVNLQLLGSNIAQAGGAYAVRALLTDSRNGEPIVGQRCRLAIEREGVVLAEAHALSGVGGTVDAHLLLDQHTLAGRATLRVGKISLPIRVRRDLRLHVTTDRTLYRGNDIVRVRLMLRHFPSGLPAASESITVALKTSGGGGDARKTVETSVHGIASTSFVLVDQAAGSCQVEARSGTAMASSKLKVKAFELPRFLVECATAEVVCRADERVPVTVRARYVDGAAVVGARVKLRVRACRVEGRRALTTDATGSVTLVCSPPGDDDAVAGWVSVAVTDQDGRTEGIEIPVRRRITRTRLQLEVVGLPVVGEALQLLVQARDPQRDQPAAGSLRWAGDGLVDAKTARGEGESQPCDARGRVRIELRPTQSKARLTLYWTAGGASVSKVFTLDSVVAKPTAPVIVPSEMVTRVGRRLTVEVLPSQGVRFLDVCRGGVTLRTLAVESAGGRARFELPVDAGLAGVLTLRAYSFGSKPAKDWGKQALAGCEQQVVVLRDARLTVVARTERESYRPGETARVRVQVRDRHGAPAPGVLGYWAVDTALLNLSPWRPASEGSFDVAPASASSRQMGLLRGGESLGFTAALAVLGQAGRIRGAAVYSLRHDWLASRRKAVASRVAQLSVARLAALRQAVIAGLGSLPLREYPHTLSMHEKISWLLRRGQLDDKQLIDTWGRPLELWSDRIWRAPGPDGVPGSDDDVVTRWEAADLFLALPKKTQLFLRFVRAERIRQGLEEEEDVMESALDYASWNTAVSVGGGGVGGRYTGRRSGRRVRWARPMPREESSPTLVFVPEHIVGPDGKATLEVPLPGATTTWRMRLVASTARGETGVAETGLLVTQPFQVEPWVASQLTVGDRLELPTLVRNGTGQALVAQLGLRVEGVGGVSPVSVVGAAAARVEIGARASRAHRFWIRAERAGTAQLHVVGKGRPPARSGGALADAVVRRLRVMPYGQLRHQLQQRAVTAATPWRSRWRVPPSTVAPARLQLTILPDALATTLSGFEGLVREPHGCFEQASSTLYPMVLALRILQERGGEAAQKELVERARRHVDHGYRRLLQFEVGQRSGGFELFGRRPANTMLTAYGLLEFSDIGKVQEIDPHLVARIRKFLTKRQAGDGSFRPSYFGTLRNAKASSFRTTAYVAWALASTGEPSAAATQWLTEQHQAVEDGYGLALASLAFSQTRGSEALGRQLARRLLGQAQQDADGQFWQPREATWLGAHGRSARLETSALVVNALLAAGQDAVPALGWLAAQRSPSGSFGTTFSTVLALGAFARAEDPATLAHGGTVHVALDGKRVSSYRLQPGVSEPIHVALGETIAAGEHSVSVSVQGRRRPRVSVKLSRWEAWPAQAAAPKGRVALAVVWPTTPVPIGRPAWCEIELRNPSPHGAQNVVAEIGLPPGCRVEVRDLQGPKPARVEREEGRLVVYLDRLPAGKELRYRLGFTPRYGLDVRSMPSKAYEYYTPEQAHFCPPARIIAR